MADLLDAGGYLTNQRRYNDFDFEILFGRSRGGEAGEIMEIEKPGIHRALAVILSVIFTGLTVMNGQALEQKDPFKREQTGQTGGQDASRLQPPPKVPFVSMKTRMIRMPRQAADELFKEQGGLARISIINKKVFGAISNMVIKSNAKVLAAPDVMTKSGSPCEVKATEECVYAGNTTPSGGKARDCGITVCLTPTIDSSGNSIALNIQTKFVSAYPQKGAQPIFLSKGLETEIVIPKGKTVLICDDAIPAPDKQEKTAENVILIIVTANVVSSR